MATVNPLLTTTTSHLLFAKLKLSVFTDTRHPSQRATLKTREEREKKYSTTKPEKRRSRRRWWRGVGGVEAAEERMNAK